MNKLNHKSKKRLNLFEISIISGLLLLLIVSATFILIKSPFALADKQPTQIIPIQHPKETNLSFQQISHVSDLSKPVSATSAKPANQIYLPILLYHKTPEDFDMQMKHLKDYGYSTVSMQEATEIINGQIKGPSKPVAITFDDGFSDQLKAFEILKKYNFKATFYIIIGSKASDYCIGVEKRNKDCGDSYLNWNEVKQISDSGLVEIGSHTVDHLQLSALDENSQRYQIFESKKFLEEKIGKRVASFAYPYGKYNQASINLVREAGYTNATTVAASEYQTSEGIMLLNRIRNTKDLR